MVAALLGWRFKNEAEIEARGDGRTRKSSDFDAFGSRRHVMDGSSSLHFYCTRTNNHRGHDKRL